MKTKTYDTELCVIGGGMAGLCCAIAAARRGVKTVIIQDRAVFGGNVTALSVLVSAFALIAAAIMLKRRKSSDK